MERTLFKSDYEQENDIVDSQSINFLEKKQRELITSSVDYNLESISNLVNKRVIDLSPKYQRRFRWNNERKSKLIESFLMNVPVPPVFLNEDDFGKYSVIDGKQRLTAISEFISGNLKLEGLIVFKDLNGLNLFDLPIEFQSSIKTRANIRAIIILRQSDKDIKYEVFQRLNTGGVNLNAQEIRNSAYPGDLNDKILELSENKLFHQLLGIKSKSQSSLCQEMKDAELVLRFFTLKDNLVNYSGYLKYNLDKYMDKNQRMSKPKVDELENQFIETLEKVKDCFGLDGCFRRWMPDKNKWKQQVSSAIFDAQMFSCYQIERTLLQNKKDRILTNFTDLFSKDNEFIKSIEKATGNPSNFNYRVQKVLEILNNS
jgi:hypothetical protein